MDNHSHQQYNNTSNGKNQNQEDGRELKNSQNNGTKQVEMFRFFKTEDYTKEELIEMMKETLITEGLATEEDFKKK